MDFFLLSLWVIPTILIWLSGIYYIARTENFYLFDLLLLVIAIILSVMPIINIPFLICMLVEGGVYETIKQDFCNHEFFKRVGPAKRIATCKKCGLELSVPRKEKEKAITSGFSIGESQGILATAIINQARFGPKK